MKRLILSLVMCVALLTLPSGSAQTLPAVLLEDYAGQAVPHTSSGLVNRLVSAVLTEFDIESSEEMFVDSREGDSRFQVSIPLDEAGLSVSFYAGQSTEADNFYIYQQITSEEVADFETVQRLVRLVDVSLSEEALQAVYDQWLAALDESQEFELGEHVVSTYVVEEAGQSLHAFEVMYQYSNAVFEEAGVQDVVTTFYDNSVAFPNIYAEDYAGNQEEVFVNRVFINRILHEIQQSFGFNLTEAHLTAMGNTLYYYPEELAAFGRVNEFYIYSGEAGVGSRLEIRFTVAHNATETPGIQYLEDQKKSFFYFFAKLLEPDLMDEEIEAAFLEMSQSEASQIQLGQVLVQTAGFTDETISMSRQLSADVLDAVFPNSISSVSQEQAASVILAENEYHAASVEQLAEPSKIYDSFDLHLSFDSGQNEAKQQVDTLAQAYWASLPHYKAPMSFTGEVIASQAQDQWLEIKAGDDTLFETYYVWTPGASLEVDGLIEVTGANLGIQHPGGKQLSVLAEQITQDGQVIYQAGGEPNE